jgi:predicted aspartyl protease
MMSCKKIFFIITLLVCCKATDLRAQSCSPIDDNDVKSFPEARHGQADKADARQKIVPEGPAETKLVMGKRLRVPVRIVYHGQVFTALFELDTGAAHTVVSQDLAEKMGVQKTQFAGQGSIADLKASAATFKVSSIAVGPLERKDYPVYILHSDQKGWSQLKDMNILGMDLLKEIPFCLDFEAGVIRWGHDSASGAGLQINTRAVIKDMRIFLPVQIVYQGQTYTEMFLLDTGSAQTFVTPVFAKMLGITDALQGGRIKLSSIQVGPLKMKDYHIGIWNTPDNLIGLDLLRYSNVTIDYAAGVVRWSL